MNTVTCIADAGLCNRIKCLVSAMRIARLTNRRVLLHWPKNERCGASFRELFDLGLDEISTRPETTTFGRSDCIALNYYGNLSLRTWRFALTDHEWHRGVRAQDFLFNERDLDPVVSSQISSCLSLLRVKRSLLDRVSSILQAQLAQPYVGVHIRGTDHNLARRLSPVTSFAQELTSVMRRDRHRLLFLATDDPPLAEALRLQFGSLFIRQLGSRNRAEPGAIEDALIDLLLLARADELLGSYGSTFSELAWWLSGFKPFKVARDWDSPVPELDTINSPSRHTPHGSTQ